MSGSASCGCGQANCGCCEGVGALTPRAVFNRPGLSALNVRIGMHGSFLATMKARLSSHVFEKERTRPLARLRVRDDDASIALLDGWATVADVLTFYSERIVNEGYLRTATEMRSVHGLANLVGYTPRPGVGASVYLSYTLDEKATEPVVIPKGARSQAVPGPGELPQFFETSEDLLARAQWNRLGVRKKEPIWTRKEGIPSDRPGAPDGEILIYLAGTTTLLKPGDPLLIAARADDVWRRPEAWRVMMAEPDADANWTKVAIQKWIVPDAQMSAGAASPDLDQLRKNPPTGDGVVATNILAIIADLPPQGVGFEESQKILIEAQAEVHKALDALGGLPAPHVRAWAAQVIQALAVLIEQPSPPEQDKCSVETLVERLTVKPPPPPVSAARLHGAVGDRFQPGGDAGLGLLASASPDFSAQLAAGLAGCVADSEPPVRIWALRLRANLFGASAPKQRKTSTSLASGGNTILGNVTTTQQGQESVTVEVGEWPIVTGDIKDGFVRRERSDRIDLEGSHDGILPQSWMLIDMSGAGDYAPDPDKPPQVAVRRGAAALVAEVVAAAPKTMRADYGVTGDVTRVRIGADKGWIVIPDDPILNSQELVNQAVANRDYEVIRGTAVYAVSEALALAEIPIERELCGAGLGGAPIELDGLYLGLEPGRYVMVSGQRADIADTTGVLGAEAAMIAAVAHDVRSAGDEIEPYAHALRRAEAEAPAVDPAGMQHKREPKRLAGDPVRTFVWLDRPLAYCYDLAELAIHANVVKATHGESQQELLGNGDASRANQSFTLKHPPLTWLPSATPEGAEDTLDVYVNDIRWNKVSGFTDLPPTERAYMLRTDHKGVTSIVFGDGREGARPPTGSQNVTALYRKGLGKAGNARPGQISQLVTRPLGVKEVVNPYRASGGADPESVDQARANAPLATKALGRLVSTDDYASFARSFAGIGKARAIELSDGRRNVVHVTIAGQDDIPIDPSSDLMAALRKAYRELGDPFQEVVVEPRDLKLLVIQAGVAIDPDRLWEPVVAAVREALLTAFGFERQGLGQGVAASAVINVIQSVAGVAMVDLDVFGVLPTAKATATGSRPLTPSETATEMAEVVRGGVRPKVDAKAADCDCGRLRPAALILLSRDVPATLVLNQLQEPA